MALTINVSGSTKIDETTGLQNDDVLLAAVPSNVSTAFSNAGVILANAIQVAGGGSDDVTVTPDSGFTVNGLGFVDPTNGALDGDASGLFTLEGRQIFLYADPNNDNVVVGREGTIQGAADPTGAIVLAIYLEETTTGSLITGGKFWTALFEPLKHPNPDAPDPDHNNPDNTLNLDNKLKVAATESTTFLFDNAPSGANEFMMFGNNPGGVSTSGIVVTGRAPDPNTEDNDHTGDTVSSSQAGPHATVGVNGQHLAPGNGLNFTMVTNPVADFTVAPNSAPERLDSTEADHEGNIQFGGYAPGVTSASFTVAQVNPTNSSVQIKISAFKDSDGVAETGTGFVEGFADDVPVNITGVKINGVVVAADLSGDTAVISGVVNGDVITYTTTSAHTRLLIENVQPTKGPGSNITLDIGGFSILSAQGASEFAGTQLQFDDDGPTAPTLAALTSVTHDETAGVQSTSDPNAQNDIAGTNLTVAILDRFNAIVQAGQAGSDPGVATKDNGAIGFAKGAGSLVSQTGGDFGTDGQANSGAIAYALSVTDGTFSGLTTTEDTRIFLYKGTGTLADLILGRVGIENGANPDTADPNGKVAFALTVDSDGTGYIAQYLSLNHGTVGTTPAAYDDQIVLNSSAVQITVTYTDRDGDPATSTPVNVGDLFKFQDDGPRITVAPPPSSNPLVLDNTSTPPISNTGNFGYDLGSDDRTTYSATSSDFVDSKVSEAGIQLALSGEVGTGADKTITNTSVSLASPETLSSATFNFSFDYDTDPLTSGVQAATASGTLSFDKVNDTFTVTLNNQIEGFSFDVLHTSELLEKNPTGNSGHPPIVVEKLANDFFVQFTADTTPLSFSFTGDENNTGDTAFGGTNDPHDLAGGTETWVSATQSTNGVAGDTIQKAELLTLRFFGEDILSDATPPVTEKTHPTTTADGIAVKFDGIGNSEDLIVTLDLIDDKGDADPTNDVEITKAIVVDNGDIIKKSTPGGVPAPYNSEFTLDNNDGLVIIESNDYNAAGEHYQIQGVQIMQSANGLTGNGINLNGGTGAGGASNTSSTQSFTSGNTNDVLKITDIGFVRTEAGTQDAHLDFSFQIVDGDGDTTATQHLLVNVLNA